MGWTTGSVSPAIPRVGRWKSSPLATPLHFAGQSWKIVGFTRLETDYDWHVFNAGAPGTGTTAQYKLIKEIAAAHQTETGDLAMVQQRCDR